MSKVLNCDLHDYLEIICMFHYQVKLTMQDGSNMVGEAVDIASKNQKEWLTLRLAKNELVDIEVDKIMHIAVLTERARFKEVSLR